MNVTMDRRNFLQKVLIGWTSILSLPFLYVMIRYIIPPAVKEKLMEIMNIGKVADIQPDTAKIIRFEKKPIALVRTTEGQVKAFSAVCTHLGCIIEYRADDKKFHCNCHGSIFDTNGQNIAGPAPRPLSPYRVQIKDDQILISQG